MKTCPVCFSVFAGRVGQIFCTKSCNLKARAKKRNIERTNPHQLFEEVKLCDVCHESLPKSLFDLTPKGTPRAACHECRREQRKKNKEIARRRSGVQSRQDKAALSAMAKATASAEKTASKAAKLALAENFVGPRKPGKWIGESEFYRWRSENDPVFYAKELDRAQEYKVRKRPGYKGSIIGWQQMPAEMITSKHLLYLISKQLKRSEGNEKH